MRELLSLLYFIGLVMFGVAVGSHTGVGEHGFMIIGGGTVVFALVAAIIRYLHKE